MDDNINYNNHNIDINNANYNNANNYLSRAKQDIGINPNSQNEHSGDTSLFLHKNDRANNK